MRKGRVLIRARGLGIQAASHLGALNLVRSYQSRSEYAGGTWYVQLTVAAPLTDIDNSGKWETDTHLGSGYAALLVKQSFKPAATVRVAGTK
jgi:hypothetical protein